MSEQVKVGIVMGSRSDWDVKRHASDMLHLYGKQGARPGRKGGHFNVLAESTDAALKMALDLRGALAAEEHTG